MHADCQLLHDYILYSQKQIESTEFQIPTSGLLLHLSGDPFLSAETAASDISTNSSIIAPTFSPLSSLSCGESVSSSIFDSEEAEAACTSLDEVVSPMQPPVSHEENPPLSHEEQTETEALDEASPIQPPLSDEEHPQAHVQEWSGFKIVSDNIDMNITPSFQRVDKVKQSLHYVHSYAVKDRVNLSGLSDKPPQTSKHRAEDLLPSADDTANIKREFCILLSR